MQIDELQLITGIDIPSPELGITVRQPKIKDIAILGESAYFLALSLFSLTKDKLNIKSIEVTNWEVFNQSLKREIEGIKNLRLLVSNFLQLFVVEKISIGPRSLIIMTGDEVKNIEPEQFDEFQSIVFQVGGGSLLNPVEEEFKPINKQAAAIAEKMKKARKKLAAMQPQAKSKGFLARYIRGVSIVTANSLEQISNMTLLQLNDLIQTYINWEGYDLEIKSRLAGAKSDKKIEHWLSKSIEKENSSIETI